MSEQLHFVSYAFNFRIIAFVLMINHFHLIVRTPDKNLAEGMAWFLRETSRAITKTSGRINQTYGGRYFRSVLGSHQYFLHCYKYLYANPLRAAIASRAEDYRFSTLNGLLGRSPLLIPVEEDLTLFSDLEGTLDWINAPVSEGNWKDVRNALRRSEFRLRKINRVDHPLELDML